MWRQLPPGIQIGAQVLLHSLPRQLGLLALGILPDLTGIHLRARQQSGGSRSCACGRPTSSISSCIALSVSERQPIGTMLPATDAPWLRHFESVAFKVLLRDPWGHTAAPWWGAAGLGVRGMPCSDSCAGGLCCSSCCCCPSASSSSHSCRSRASCSSCSCRSCAACADSAVVRTSGVART